MWVVVVRLAGNKVNMFWQYFYQRLYQIEIKCVMLPLNISVHKIYFQSVKKT